MPESRVNRTSPAGTSLVFFQLAPHEAGGTTLSFTHRYIPGSDTLIGFGAGWHALFESLNAFLTGGPGVDAEALYERLRPQDAAHFISAI